MGQVIYIGSIREYLELDKNKVKDPDKYKRIEIIYDLNKIRKEVNEMTDQEKNDKKKFSAEELKVDAYLSSHKGVSYREAVLACLDKSEEGEGKKAEFSELSSDEISGVSKNLDEAICNMDQAKKVKAFSEVDEGKILEAYNLIKQVKGNFDILVEKNK
ncbi:hypothetical protein ES695_02515 [Candidatus Atribacteria bacterium 1244-E10-H5-B2]|nr:MAG: hypothetical protein ES695_02515 [Candidatus Atribacteria bacterium 1244-E10-H5-B2]